MVLSYLTAIVQFCIFQLHCVKSVQIRSFFWSEFSRIWTEYERYGVSLRIQSKCSKIQTSKNSVFGHFSRSAHTFNSCFSENELTWYSFFLSKEMIFSCKRYKHQLQHFLLLQQVFMPRSSHKVEGRELSVD